MDIDNIYNVGVCYVNCLTYELLFPEDVFPTDIISSEWRLAKILIGLFVRRSDMINLFSSGETV